MTQTLDGYQADVADFMQAGGQQVRDEPTIPPIEELWLGINMIQSEVNEMKRAITSMKDAANGNDDTKRREALIEYADALGDIVYVAFGRAAAAGIPFGPVLEEISASNNSKINWKTREPWAVHPSGKIAKDHHFREPDLGRVMFGG